MSTMRCLGFALALVSTWMPTWAGRAVSAAPPVPVVVELFTSEGCSSCPPADQLLAELVSKQPVPGALVIGLSEHVDYWDSLGWKDPFSNALFTRRQSAYATAAGAGDVYTPQMLINGVEAIVGSDRGAALAAIGRAVAKPAAAVALTWPTPGHLDVHVAAGVGAVGDRVVLALTEDAVRSSVTRGENEGHTLDHVNVTRRLTVLGAIGAGGAFRITSPVTRDPAWHAGHCHVTVFVQRGEGGRVLAATTMPLPS